MSNLRASLLSFALVSLLVPRGAGASADVVASPSEMVFKSPLELVVARTNERTGQWRSLCLEARGGAARIPVAALERFGLPQLHRLHVSHAGGVESELDGSMSFRSVAIVRFVADVPPRDDIGDPRYYRVEVIINNGGGQKLFPDATVKATELDNQYEELADGESIEFALELDVEPAGHCPVPKIRWSDPPSRR